MVAIAHPGLVHTPHPARRCTPAVYRRRRLAVVGALLVLLALASLVGHVLADVVDGAAQEPRPVGHVAVTVAPGDTVWSIASELARGQDPRPVVDAIVEANGGSMLVAGQRLDLALR